MYDPCLFSMPRECQLRLHSPLRVLMLSASEYFSSILGIQQRSTDSIRDWYNSSVRRLAETLDPTNKP